MPAPMWFSLTPRDHAFIALYWAALAASAFYFGQASDLGWSVALAGLLSALTMIDLKTYRLPNILTLAVAGLGAVMVYLTRADMWLFHVIGGVIGYGVLWAMEVGYKALRGRDGLGRGDAKLLGALGLWVGWMGLAPTLLIASFGGLAFGIISQLRVKSDNGSPSVIAFGPWIALGGWIIWLAGPSLRPLLGY